ncbi:unnamed protein product, partial [Didymodactylos carnosus]
LYAYFDPLGLSVLTNRDERAPVGHEIKNIYRDDHHFSQTLQQAQPSAIATSNTNDKLKKSSTKSKSLKEAVYLPYWLTQKLFLSTETRDAPLKNAFQRLLLNKFTFYFESKVTFEQKRGEL